MQNNFWRVLVLALASVTVFGCAPLVIGAAGVIIVDEVLEQENGDDGLF